MYTLVTRPVSLTSPIFPREVYRALGTVRWNPFVHLHGLNSRRGNSLDFCNRTSRHFLVPSWHRCYYGHFIRTNAANTIHLAGFLCRESTVCRFLSCSRLCPSIAKSLIAVLRIAKTFGIIFRRWINRSIVDVTRTILQYGSVIPSPRARKPGSFRRSR